MLLVDAANVVGARPDGWWRDRPAAAARLVDALRLALAAGRLDGPAVVVLEGAARAGAPEGTGGDLRVVHATGSGDDALVDLAAAAVAGAHPVLVVTADRALRDRLLEAGVDVLAPRDRHRLERFRPRARRRATPSRPPSTKVRVGNG